MLIDTEIYLSEDFVKLFIEQWYIEYTSGAQQHSCSFMSTKNINFHGL